ncbi:MAG: hypothetical protein LBR11_00550 [Deltaproteobacteria bacterium]|jgi:hypothetical protein|nr:hypothetical protein [Deltaproteobacteria bacterium]
MKKYPRSLRVSRAVEAREADFRAAWGENRENCNFSQKLEARVFWAIMAIICSWRGHFENWRASFLGRPGLALTAGERVMTRRNSNDAVLAGEGRRRPGRAHWAQAFWGQVFWILALLAFSSGCAVKLAPDQPQPLSLNQAAVRAVLETGDWLVIRGLTGPDNFIIAVTNMPFSHAAIYDAENDEVIEADGRGVHRTALNDFLAKASRIWVLKPIWATPETRPLAVARARSLVGSSYDFTGLLGLGLESRYYCSELVISAWRPFMDPAQKINPIPRVISPGRLHHWGRVVYDSLGIGLGRVPAPK